MLEKIDDLAFSRFLQENYRDKRINMHLTAFSLTIQALFK